MTFAEFFAGIGLVRLGLEQAGWACHYANDINRAKAEMYRLNFGGAHLEVGDVVEVHGSDVPTVTLATASFPCQDLSLAGKRGGLAGERSGTFSEFARILGELAAEDRHPRAVMLENVTGLLTSHKGADIRVLLESLNSLGYACDLLVIDAVRFVPQSRPRVFILGLRGGPARAQQSDEEALDHPFRPAAVRKVVENNADLRWQFLDLPAPPTRTKTLLADVVERSQPPMNGERLARERSYIRDRSQARLETALAQARMTGERVYLAGYKRMRKGLVSLETRDDAVAGCLRALSGGSSWQLLVEARPDGEVSIRFMTAREYARLQGVPDSFILPADERLAVHAFGDAVAVPVVAWLGTVLARALEVNHDAERRVPLDRADEALVVNR